MSSADLIPFLALALLFFGAGVFGTLSAVSSMLISTTPGCAVALRDLVVIQRSVVGAAGIVAREAR